MPNPSPGPMPLFRSHQATGRPWPLTVLSLGGALLLGLSWWRALAGNAARAFGPGYWAYLVATTASLAVALWGIWHLRRWARWAFPAALLLDNAVLAAIGEVRGAVLGVEAALVLVVLAYGRAFRGTSNEKPQPGADGMAGRRPPDDVSRPSPR